MYIGAIKAVTRGSLRRLLDYENQQHQEEQDRLQQDPLYHPPIFTIYPKHNNDAASVASSITDIVAFSSVFGGENEHDQHETTKK
eukprot:8891110-Ditylum_brightwellii.AAC.1